MRDQLKRKGHFEAVHKAAQRLLDVLNKTEDRGLLLAFELDAKSRPKPSEPIWITSPIGKPYQLYLVDVIDAYDLSLHFATMPSPMAQETIKSAISQVTLLEDLAPMRCRARNTSGSPKKGLGGQRRECETCICSFLS